MTAEEAKLKAIWYSIPKHIRDHIETRVGYGETGVLIDKLSPSVVSALTYLGYEIQRYNSTSDIIKWCNESNEFTMKFDEV
jgi:hypothetical protein